MLVTVVLMVIIVQLFQLIGSLIEKKIDRRAK